MSLQKSKPTQEHTSVEVNKLWVKHSCGTCSKCAQTVDAFFLPLLLFILIRDLHLVRTVMAI